MTNDEKRRLYVLIDRAPHMDATTIWFWIAIGITVWSLFAVLAWSVWTLIHFNFWGNS